MDCDSTSAPRFIHSRSQRPSINPLWFLPMLSLSKVCFIGFPPFFRFRLSRNGRLGCALAIPFAITHFLLPHIYFSTWEWDSKRVIFPDCVALPEIRKKKKALKTVETLGRQWAKTLDGSQTQMPLLSSTMTLGINLNRLNSIFVAFVFEAV